MKSLIVAVVLGILLTATGAQAQIAVEKLKYPVTAITTQDKLEFCYIAQEKLRLEHNAKGKDYREGKITKAEWNEYLSIIFNPKLDLIIGDLLIHKSKMLKSTKYEVDLNDLEK